MTHVKRKKKTSKGERIFLAIVSVLGIIAVTIFVCLFISDVVRKHELRNNGTAVTGVVDAKDIHYTHAKTGTFTRRTVDYHFQTIDGVEQFSRKEVPVTSREYEKLAEQGAIELRYNAKEPSMNAPASALWHVSPTYSIIFILAGIIGSILLYSRFVKKFGKQFFDAKSKNRWTGFFKFVLQMMLLFSVIFGGGFVAGLLVQGLNLLLFPK